MSIVFTCPSCKEQNSVGPEFAGRRGSCAFCGEAVIVPQTSGEAQLAPDYAKGAPRKSSGAPWIVILAVCCVVLLFCGGILAGLLLPAINATREAGRRSLCMNNLHQIGLAMAMYESKNGKFPPAAGVGENGQPPMSWRVAILPYMQEDEIYRNYDPKQPWNSPKNLEVLKKMPREFRCPSDSDSGDGETSYFMISGKNTVGGLLGSAGASPFEITDGLSKTMTLVEVHGLKVPWTEPRDLTVDQLIARLRSGARIAHIATFNIGLADGSVRNLPASIDAETLRRLATINDGKPVQIDAF
jgi:hypothetical protein